MSAHDEEDEELKLAIKMSLEQAEKEKDWRALAESAPGAVAFLERQKTIDLRSPPTITYGENKSSKDDESQQAPKSTSNKAHSDDADSVLEPPLHRKTRASSNENKLRESDEVIIIDDSVGGNEKSKETKVARTDSQLARLLASMTDQEVAEFLSNEERANSEPQLVVEAPKSTNSSPPLSQPLNNSASSIRSQSSSLPTQASVLPSHHPHISDWSPFIAPQRYFRLNWVVTLPAPPRTRSVSSDPLPEYVRLRDLVCHDALRAVFTTFKVDMTWLVAAVPKLITIPSVTYHADPSDIYRAAELGARPGSPRQKLWSMILEARQRQRSAANLPSRSEPPSEPPFDDVKIREDSSRMWTTPHAKVSLVIYPRWLRVIVTSANLCESDWERKTQGIWFQDFPLKADTEANSEQNSNSFPHGSPASSSSSSASANYKEGQKLQSLRMNALSQEEITKARALARDFEAALKDFFTLISSKKFDISLFEQYDYRNVRVCLVTSVIRLAPLEMSRNYGFLKMASLLSKEPQPPLGTKSDSTVQLYSQMSSMGKVSRKWLETLRESFASESTGSKKTTGMKIVWPSVSFVRDSIDGWMSGGSLCIRDKNLLADSKNAVSFMMQYVSAQPDRVIIPPHIKSYWKVYSDGTLGWMCLTSANLSKSAWGEIQKGPNFAMNNYEVGVLFLPSLLSIPSLFGEDVLGYGDDSSQATRKKVRLLHGTRLTFGTSIIGAQTFYDIILPMPFKLNAKSYVPEYLSLSWDDQPWSMDKPRLEPDRLGEITPGFN